MSTFLNECASALEAHKARRPNGFHEAPEGSPLREYLEHYGLIYRICSRNVRRRVTVTDDQADELRDEALLESWKIWRRLSAKPADSRKPALDRAKIAARMAAKRARVRLVRERNEHDRRTTVAQQESDEIVVTGRVGRTGEPVQHYVPRHYRDVDRAVVEKEIASLPKDLQPYARLKSYGLGHGMIAERRGESCRTVERRIGEIRKLLAPAPLVYRKLMEGLRQVASEKPLRCAGWKPRCEDTGDKVIPDGTDAILKLLSKRQISVAEAMRALGG